MPLVRAEELGFVSTDDPAQAPLVIPASAPLITGRRAIVYIERPDAERPTYEGREVVLGPRAGDFYLIESGLAEGERVVVNGNFKIDSALQIQGRPSMMSPEEEDEEPGGPRVEIPAVLRETLSRIFDAYFGVQRSLAADDLTGAHEALGGIRIALDEVRHEDLTGDFHQIWHPIAEAIGEASSAVAEASDLDQSRLAFRDLSVSMLRIEEAFGHPGDTTHYQIFCPMAFANQGASWLQTSREVLNPYFGPAMVRCGEVRGSFAPAAGR
jgi:Cu(I)/Ag(I) efflux system membrane fusion protein